jgi:hypothetical protein
MADSPWATGGGAVDPWANVVEGTAEGDDAPPIVEWSFRQGSGWQRYPNATEVEMEEQFRLFEAAGGRTSPGR